MLLPAKAPKITVEFNNNNVDNSDYFTTSTFNNVVRSKFFYHAWKHTFFWELFWRILFICIWIKSCSWRYYVIRDMVLCQHLSWCSGLHRLSYILCWQNRRWCRCVYKKLLHIDPYDQFFSVSCILWDKCGEGFTFKQLYHNYWVTGNNTSQSKTAVPLR